jgi:hypothetical protein
MVVQLTPAGILLGADRNVTSQVLLHGGHATTVLTGQAQRPKVLKWPNHELIVGYVGQANLAGKPTEEWLYAFIGRHLQFNNLQEVADALTADLNSLFHAFPDQTLILHLCGFEMETGEAKPRIYFIRNTTALTTTGNYVVGNQFDCSDEIIDPKYFGTKKGNQIRADLVPPAYFSFRQGYKLAAFNTIEVALRLAMNALVDGKLQPAATTLEQLAKQVKFQIHGYGAYFASFNSPLEQFVGGGADVVTATWP